MAISLIVLVLSLFLGLAFRFVTNPQILEEKLQEQLQGALGNYDLILKKPRISLKNSFVPELALRVESLSVKSQSFSCGPGFDLISLSFPLTFNQVFSGDFKIARARAEQVLVDLREDESCQSEKSKITQEPQEIRKVIEKLDPEKARAQVQEVLLAKDEPVLHVQKLRPHIIRFLEPIKRELSKPLYRDLSLRTIHIGELKLRSPEFVKELVFQTIDLDLSKAVDDEAGSQVEMQFELLYPELFLDRLQNQSRIFFKIGLNSQRVELLNRFRAAEGKIESLLQFGIESEKSEDWTLDFESNMDHFSLSSLTQILETFDVLQFNKKPEFSWLDCRINFREKISSLAELKLYVQDCRTSGRLGKIRLPNLIWSVRKGFIPFQVAFEKLNLDQLSEILSWTAWRGTFDRLGLVQGELLYKNANDIEVKAILKDAYLRISGGGLRKSQHVELLGFKLHRSEERISLLIDQGKIERGEIEGTLTANASHDFRSGLIQFDLKKLNFDPAIEKMIFGGDLQGLAMVGQLKFLDKKLDFFRGLLKSSEMKGTDYSFKDLKIESELKRNEVHMKLKAQSGSIKGELYDFLKSMFLEYSFPNNELIITDVKSRLRLKDHEVSWEKFKASIKGDISIGSTGGWNESEDLYGQLQIKFPSLRSIYWNLQGTKSKPEIEIDMKQLKQVVSGLKDKDIRESVHSLLDSYNKQEGGDLLRQIGNRLFKKAGSLVPDFLKGADSKEDVEAQ